MPLTKDNGEAITLRNEITERDFDGVSWNWLRSSFNSAQYYRTEADDAPKQKLADFLNDNMKGPYFIVEGFANTREILEIILFHPDDHHMFSGYAKNNEWFAKVGDHVERNVNILLDQMRAGFDYENPAMRSFMAELKLLAVNFQSSLDLATVEDVMRATWRDADRPALDVRTVPRVPLVS